MTLEDYMLTDESAYDHFFPLRLDEPYRDMQGNWKLAWLCFIKRNGRNMCAIADKLVADSEEEIWDDVGTKKTCRMRLKTVKC